MWGPHPIFNRSTKPRSCLLCTNPCLSCGKHRKTFWFRCCNFQELVVVARKRFTVPEWVFVSPFLGFCFVCFNKIRTANVRWTDHTGEHYRIGTLVLGVAQSTRPGSWVFKGGQGLQRLYHWATRHNQTEEATASGAGGRRGSCRPRGSRVRTSLWVSHLVLLHGKPRPTPVPCFYQVSEVSLLFSPSLVTLLCSETKPENGFLCFQLPVLQKCFNRQISLYVSTITNPWKSNIFEEKLLHTAYMDRLYFSPLSLNLGDKSSPDFPIFPEFRGFW